MPPRRKEKLSVVVNATEEEFVTVDTSEPHSDTRSKSVSSGEEHGVGHFLSTLLSAPLSLFLLFLCVAHSALFLGRTQTGGQKLGKTLRLLFMCFIINLPNILPGIMFCIIPQNNQASRVCSALPSMFHPSYARQR